MFESMLTVEYAQSRHAGLLRDAGHEQWFGPAPAKSRVAATTGRPWWWPTLRLPRRHVLLMATP